ncbi:MAG: 30S ribosomal protein S17 [Candidatus Obscuribacterales bacterium]|nr:30S ribosomal protein S17 [Candidatus Obscuribacterales bacterium]
MPRKELVGKVVSNKMQKTVVVAVESHVQHRKYEKQTTKTTKFKAHDPENKCQMGDRVRIQECPPLSKTKCFQVIAVLGSPSDAGVKVEG